MDAGGIAGLITALGGAIAAVVGAVALLRRSSTAGMELRYLVRRMYDWMVTTGVWSHRAEEVGPVDDDLKEQVRTVMRRYGWLRREDRDE